MYCNHFSHHENHEKFETSYGNKALLTKPRMHVECNYQEKIKGEERESPILAFSRGNMEQDLRMIEKHSCLIHPCKEFPCFLMCIEIN